MKLVRILLLLIGLVVISGLSLNTLATKKVIASSPLTKAGLGSYTWDSVGSMLANTKQLAGSSIAGSGGGNWLGNTWQSAQTQLNSLVSRSQTVSQTVSKITGNQPLIGVAASPTKTASSAAIQAAASSSSNTTTSNAPSPTLEPFYTKALDYGKYVYCQEVVRDYETQHPELKPTGK